MLTFAPHIAKQIRESERPIIVTGATGWLGRATLEMLVDCLGHKFPTRVIAYGTSSRLITLSCGLLMPVHAIDMLQDLPYRPYIFLHYAFITKGRINGMSSDEFMLRNEQLAVFVQGQMDRLQIDKAFVPSSGAVTHTNPYGIMKARDEYRFLKLAEIIGMRLVLGRIFNLSGPFINKINEYAMAAILSDIIAGRTVDIRAAHPVIRSYVHVRDVINLAFSLLLVEEGAPGIFDFSGEEEIEIGAMARRAAILLGKPDIKILRPEITGVTDRYVGKPNVMKAMMRAHEIPVTNFNDQIRDTAAYLSQGA